MTEQVNNSFIITKVFEKAASSLWSESEIQELKHYLLQNPLSGDVIRGSGGIRKLRWGMAGKGKRGGARIIYYHYHATAPLCLIAAYAKTQKTDLSPQEIAVFKGFVQTIKEQFSNRLHPERK